MSKPRYEKGNYVGSVIADFVVNGFNDGTIERVGGALVLAATKQVIALIRGDENASSVMSIAGDAVGAGTKATTVALETVGAGTLGLGAAPLGVLSLAVVQMEFAVLLKRVTRIERRLQETQVLLEQVNRKLDLGFYSNFSAALDLASRAFHMEKETNRRDAAWQAVNRLAEARRHYTKLADFEITAKSRLATEYLATLLLAYAAEIRCYLEMEEPEEAIKLLELGTSEIWPLAQCHVNNLLTSNRAAYLHPYLIGKIDLRRFTDSLRSFDPTLDENKVFEQQRENYLKLGRGLGEWIRTLPSAIWDPVLDGQRPASATTTAIKSNLLNWDFGKWFNNAGPTAGMESKIFERLASTFDSIKGLIEDMRRFQGYKAEIQAVQRLGIDFSRWRETQTPDTTGDKKELLVITSLDALDLTMMPVNDVPM
jgi:tetratricopeptide (TPR) repeat protein